MGYLNENTELKLLAAARNKGKAKEIERLLVENSQPVTVYSLADFNIDTDAPETGGSFDALCRRSQSIQR